MVYGRPADAALARSLILLILTQVHILGQYGGGWRKPLIGRGRIAGFASSPEGGARSTAPAATGRPMVGQGTMCYPAAR